MTASSEFADYILGKFSPLDIVTAKPMMGSFVIHMAGKVLGFISDDLPVSKPQKSRKNAAAEPGDTHFPFLKYMDKQSGSIVRKNSRKKDKARTT